MTKRALPNDDYDFSGDEPESVDESSYAAASNKPDVLDYQDKMNDILDKLDNEDDYLLNNENDYDGDENEEDESENSIESPSLLSKRNVDGLSDDDYLFDLNNNNNNNEEDAYLSNNVNTDDEDELSNGNYIFPNY